MGERKIASVMIEVTNRGVIEPLACFFDIKKETDKAVYPDHSSANYDAKQSIRYLSRMVKSDLGTLHMDDYTSSFRMIMYNIVESQEDFIQLVEEVKSRVQSEIQKRVNLASSWEEAYKETLKNWEGK
jgi:hypothetical protein